MKIASFSDSHWQYMNIKSFPKADMLLFAGDWSGRGEESEAYDFCKWFSELPYKIKIAVPGNHERFVNYFPKDIKKLFADSNIQLLIDESVSIENINIYGTPYCPLFGDGNWAFLESENKLYNRFLKIPNNTNILLTHCPPHNILDNGYGSVALKEVLKKKHINYHIFGHIHESFGNKVIKDTKYYNVSVLDEDYLLKNPITVFEV